MPLEPFPYEAKDQLRALIRTLEQMTAADGEHEVQGIALSVLDEVLSMVRDVLRGHRIVGSARNVISHDLETPGMPIRAVDALLVARHLDRSIGEPPPPGKRDPDPHR